MNDEKFKSKVIIYFIYLFYLYFIIFFIDVS